MLVSLHLCSDVNESGGYGPGGGLRRQRAVDVYRVCSGLPVFHSCHGQSGFPRSILPGLCRFVGLGDSLPWGCPVHRGVLRNIPATSVQPSPMYSTWASPLLPSGPCLGLGRGAGTGPGMQDQLVTSGPTGAGRVASGRKQDLLCTFQCPRDK